MNYRRYYDFQWQQTGGKEHPYIAEKTKIFLDIIPHDVSTIIDVGCGDGAISNVFAPKHTVIGVDISQEGLKNLSAEALPVLSTVDYLPFKNNCADLALCSELLEHLPKDILMQAITEIKRISKRYILISVPNKENLRKRYTKCNVCGLEFHIYCHLMSFNLNKLARYFDGYTISYSTLCGALDEKSFDTISYLRNKLAKHFCIDTISTLCPKCGNIVSLSKPSLVRRAIGYSLFILQNTLNLLLNRKPEPDWLVALFEKSKQIREKGDSGERTLLPDFVSYNQ